MRTSRTTMMMHCTHSSALRSVQAHGIDVIECRMVLQGIVVNLACVVWGSFHVQALNERVALYHGSLLPRKALLCYTADMT